MQRKQLLTRTLLTSAAILSLTVPNLVLAGPKTETRGSHGAAVIVSVPMMDAKFPMMSSKLGMGVTPFNLVFLAYQGFFTSEKIPSALGLIQAARDGKVTAADLTKAAISMNRLSPESLQDQNFQAQVESQLETLTRANQ
jgi:hypothetical protein